MGNDLRDKFWPGKAECRQGELGYWGAAASIIRIHAETPLEGFEHRR